MTREPIRPGPHTGLERLVRLRQLVHIADLTAETAYRERDPLRVASVELAGMRTFLAVPLLKEEALLGAFVLYRQEVYPFSDKQIALLQNFAAQAVIAIDNARLITETRRSNLAFRENEERYALVTQAVAEGIYEWDIKSNSLWVSPRLIEIFGLAEHSLTAADWNSLVHPEDFPLYRAALRMCFKGTTPRLDCEYRVRHSDGSYRWIEDRGVPVRDEAGRAVRMVGALTDISSRREADEDLREALEQQTATAEVLQVINSSPGDLAPVFAAILQKAHALCGADHGHLTACEGGQFRALATHGVPEAFEKLLRQPFRPGLDVSRRLRAGESVIQFPDMAALSYDPDDRIGRGAAELAGARTLLIVALRKDDALLGYITAHRTEVRPFSEKEIALLQNFAAQAVIAMENARLLGETARAHLRPRKIARIPDRDQRCAAGDQAGRSSIWTPVLQTVVTTAVNLCHADLATIYRNDDGEYRWAAGHMLMPEFEKLRAQRPHPARRRDAGRAGRDLRPNRSDPRCLDRPAIRNQKRCVGLAAFTRCWECRWRATACWSGVIGLARRTIQPFSEREIQLVSDLCRQAVIAIENARLLTETREALEQQIATAEVLQVINSSPGDLAPVFDAILEKAHTAVRRRLWQLRAL